ncbi:sushi, von Willebrand factor type a, egf and pentraxin domain-containing protein 1-like [Plakobranchus ocellatus]|uniref:Sushi, von Willebrand factor type a, egf and pentraxin domain-containing protein 1-like n=1 Tax=Plakobranchus ocellatus TaxID=259542 RepID=A0AAV4DN40_9GAST|nr:sushi, von Willebrand factor type a, egf and pentraxin domain-containing protein 1-like [Plakobranchus ocellatus]
MGKRLRKSDGNDTRRMRCPDVACMPGLTTGKTGRQDEDYLLLFPWTRGWGSGGLCGRAVGYQSEVQGSNLSPGARAEELRCEHQRDSANLTRKCTKSCRTHYDCRSPRKECHCDGKCGKSCINPNLECIPEPRDIQNGRVRIVPYNRFAALANYECNDGYSLVGLHARVCQGDETWSGEPPRCELSHGLPDVDEYCHFAPAVHHATHDGRPGKTKFEKSTQLMYRCDKGYTAHKDSVNNAWCVGGGKWVGPNITCISQAAGCEMPPPIDHGEVKLITANMAGGRARYFCQQGYFLVGSGERICQEDGTWSGRQPSCKKVVCGPPPKIENAEHDAPSDQVSFAGGTQLSYSCRFGYFRDGSPRAICNGQRGMWDGPNMQCRGGFKTRDCENPGEIENGWRDTGYRFTYPAKVTYHCDEGFEMKRSASPYRTCEANGEWSGELPECLPVHCKTLSPPTHGTMIGSGTAFRTKIIFECHHTFRLLGSKERTCSSDRTWTGQETRCEEIDCGLPEPLWNGYMDGIRTTVGAIYMFRCNIRTKFKGSELEARCTENGEWSIKTPLCLGKQLISFTTEFSYYREKKERKAPNLVFR